MRNFDDFDREFDAAFRSTKRLAIGGFIVTSVISLAAVAGIAFVVWKVLVHFGVL